MSDEFLRLVLKGPSRGQGNTTLVATAFSASLVSSLSAYRDDDIANHSRKLQKYQAERLDDTTVGGYNGLAWTASWHLLGSTIKSYNVTAKVGATIYCITYQGVIEDYASQLDAVREMLASVRFSEPK